MTVAKIDTLISMDRDISSVAVSDAASPTAKTKDALRTSLKASTLDGVFATIFTNTTSGVLLSNFLIELNASPIEIGMLASIPMLVNLLQPLGAFLSERTTSRRNYGFWIFGISRLLWLILPISIGLSKWYSVEPHQIVIGTLTIVCITNILNALGSASWLSWIATLVPQRLRGRYFGFRSSAASLTSLLSIPIAGWMVATWRGGSFQGYKWIVLLGVLAGIISLAFQKLKIDVNPQEQKVDAFKENIEGQKSLILDDSILKDGNFLKFLLFFGAWMFAVNLSGPFFNLYMLDNLNIDVRYVTLYSSLHSGAYLMMLILWGKLSDRIGNRPILLLIGVVVAATPILWIGTGVNALSVWLLLPLLHLLAGGTWAAIDLCNNNLQLEIAPIARQSNYFALVAAIGGVSGALGTTAGSFLAQYVEYGGLALLFALSSILRLAALIPLVFVHEEQGHSLERVMSSFFPFKLPPKVDEF